MPIFCLTGWSFVPGDCAYIDAASALEASLALVEELNARDLDDTQVRPRVSWVATELAPPIRLIVFRD